MKLTTPNSENLPRIKKLYRSAFPRIERKPFRFIMRQCRRGEAELFAVEADDGRFAGLAFLVKYKDIVLLDYFAVHTKLRGKGIGSRALRTLLERYANKRLILEIESVDEPCKNLAERQKRREFYLRNGMQPAGFTAHVFLTELEVLTAGKPVTFGEYRELYRAQAGARAARHVTLSRYSQ